MGRRRLQLRQTLTGPQRAPSCLMTCGMAPGRYTGQEPYFYWTAYFFLERPWGGVAPFGHTLLLILRDENKGSAQKPKPRIRKAGLLPVLNIVR